MKADVLRDKLHRMQIQLEMQSKDTSVERLRKELKQVNNIKIWKKCLKNF